jgi:hypothetical protein
MDDRDKTEPRKTATILTFPTVGKHAPAKPTESPDDGYSLDVDLVCLHCDHAWEDNIPTGQLDGHTCPSCNLDKGVISVLIEHSEGGWECGSCNGYLFRLTRTEEGHDEAMCILCGGVHVDFNR